MPISSSPWVAGLLRDLEAFELRAERRALSVSRLLRIGKVTWK